MSAGITQDFEIRNTLGLHARAAATLVKVTTRFTCEVLLERDGQQANGKSILGVMTLAAARGTTVRVTCVGADQAEALAAIGQVIDSRFGEE